jgi:hypothetical protein
MGIGLKMINGEMIGKNSETEYKAKPAVDIGRFLTQTLVWKEKIHS